MWTMTRTVSGELIRRSRNMAIVHVGDATEWKWLVYNYESKLHMGRFRKLYDAKLAMDAIDRQFGLTIFDKVASGETLTREEDSNLTKAGRLVKAYQTGNHDHAET